MSGQQQRRVAAVTTPARFGADGQVDGKAIIIEPGRWDAHDPFLMMAEDWFSTVGFDWHPHRGIETVTVVLDGELEHRDNTGGHGILGPGDVQWMTAGRGIVHSELARGGEGVHTLQLWLNLPAAAKMADPGYQDLRAADMPVRRGPGFEALVYSGRSGDVIGPARNHVATTMVDARLDPDATFVQELPPGTACFAYVLAGAGRFGADATPASAGRVVALAGPNDDDADELGVVATSDGVRFLLFAGVPLREPVVAYGPFVMNTEAQIKEAFADYRAGRFGPVPVT